MPIISKIIIISLVLKPMKKNKKNKIKKKFYFIRQLKLKDHGSD